MTSKYFCIGHYAGGSEHNHPTMRAYRRCIVKDRLRRAAIVLTCVVVLSYPAYLVWQTFPLFCR